MRPVIHKITGKDKKPHAMTLRRKARKGIAQFRDVTKPMPAVEIQYIRARAKRTRREAQHREWILLLPAPMIAARVTK